MAILSTPVLLATRLIEQLTAQPAWTLAVALSAVMVIVGIYIKPIAWLASLLRKRHAAVIATSLKRKTHVASFTDTEIEEAVRHYIEPDSAIADPANEDDLRNFAIVREPIFTVVDRALNATDRIHLLVLADSGMGKTTLLLNLFARELKKAEIDARKLPWFHLAVPKRKVR